MRRILFLFFLIPLFGACTSDMLDFDEGYNPATPLRFVTTDADADDDTGAATRGTPITAASEMTTLGVFASATGTTDWSKEAKLGKMFNQKLTSDGGTWKYVGQDVHWDPVTLADRYSFFAYSPYGTGAYDASDNDTGNGITVSGSKETAGIPTLTYTVPVKVQNQPDLMVAVPKKNMRPTASPVPLPMEHALTSVGFQIAGNGEKVKGISIQGVKMTGTLAIDGDKIVWDGLGAVTDTDFSASLNYDEEGAGAGLYHTTTSAMSTDLIAGNGYLMMIPQTLGDDAKVVVTFEGDSTKTLSLRNQTWEAGQRVAYHISLKEGPAPPEGGIVYGDKAFLISVDENGELNVEGRGYSVYFKWGSLIARSGEGGNGDEFDAGDIVWTPDGYNYEELMTKIDTMTRKNAWDLVPYQTGRTIIEKVSEGLGDPCLQISEGEWRMPTFQDVVDFVGYDSEKISSGLSYPSSGSNWEGKLVIYYNWYDKDENNEPMLGVGHFPKGTAQGQRLPAAGSVTHTGMVQEQDECSRYWISEAWPDIDDHRRYMYFQNEWASTQGHLPGNNGANVRCVGNFISVWPTTYTFPDEGGEHTFEVTASGTPTILKTVGNWFNASISGNILTVEADPNTGSANREGTITLAVERTSGTYTVDLPIKQDIAMVESELAPPGVIGYIKGTNTLTLKGSTEYSVNNDIKQYAIDNFGGLSDSTVYVAYFKFGSLVAISSDYGDKVAPYFEPLDIIAAPNEWKNSLDEARYYVDYDWNKIPVSANTSEAVGVNASGAYGDPCIYYFKNEYTGGWKTPIGNPYNGTGWEGTQGSIMPGSGLPWGHMSGRDGEKGWFYPGVQGREVNAQVQNDSFGHFEYRSSTAYYDLYSYNMFQQIDPNHNATGPHYGFAVRCVRPHAEISLNPAATDPFAIAGETREFEIKTKYFTGTPKIITNDNWIEAKLNEDGDKLIVTAKPNTTQADRTTEIKLTAGTYSGSNTKITIIQDHTMEGVLAPPGVIGYVRGTNELTLQGSKEYESDNSIRRYADDNFGGLSDSTVYVALFKFGSLVAVSSDKNDTSKGVSGSDYLQWNDIIAGPEEYATSLAALRNNPTWENIPYTKNQYITSDPANGLGDPCQYYFADKGMYQGGFGFDPNQNWRLPTGNPYNGYSSSNLSTWVPQSGLIPAGRTSQVPGENGVFYPATGQRNQDNGQITDQGGGIFWSSTTRTYYNYWNDYAGGYYLYINSNGTLQVAGDPASYAKTRGQAVRCVKTAPTISIQPEASIPGRADTVKFAITTDNFTDVAEAEKSVSWIASARVKGDTLTVIVRENTSTTTDRTGTVAVYAGSGTTGIDTAYLKITQRHAVGGVLAPPGVIGYIKNTDQLTLKGSTEYSTYTDIAQYAKDNFDGLSDKTVYVAYFMFGSLVALSGDPLDKNATNGSYIQTDDIVAGPTNWPGWTDLKNNPTWAKVPRYSIGESTIYTYPDTGKGDPCEYWFEGKYEYNWRLPKGNPYNGYSNSSFSWIGTSGNDFYGIVDNDDPGVFFPAAGHRSDSNGAITEMYQRGLYFSRTPNLNNNEAYNLWFLDGNRVEPYDDYVYNRGQAIRCVPR